MRYEIFDAEDGIDLALDMENGMVITLRMDDETAQEMVSIIQNKLNAR